MKKSGFTLIEIVVVVGVLGLIMVTVSSILINSFKSKSRISLADEVDQSGTAILAELKNNIVVAAGVGMTCVTNGVGVGSTLSILSVVDGKVTNLVCYEGSRIASESASGSFTLSSGNVRVTGCSNFARCELFPDSTDRIINVDFSFNVSTGTTAAGVDKYVSREFRSSMVVRN